MVRLVGLYKELGDNEHLVMNGKIIVPTVFVREAEVKKFIGRERKGFPLSYFISNVYLTNKRLMFLIFRELEALALQKKGIPSLTGIEGTWFEIPTSAIYNVEVIRKEISKDKELRAVFPSLSKHDAVPTVEISYSRQRASGKLKAYVESIFNEEGMTKHFNLKNIEAIFDKVQLIGEQTMGMVPKLTQLSKSMHARPLVQ